ncbi:MAG: ferredoxin [Candidatus Omnitrophota bacterium]
MKAIVDKETCTGCELCTQTCPEVYEMQGDVAVVTADPVPEDAELVAKQAAEDCPVEAITIEE